MAEQEIDRRSFCQATAASSLAAGTAAALGAKSAGASTAVGAASDNLHVALIGAGGQGRWDTGFLLQVPGVKVTAVCEINPICVAEVKKMAPDARVYEDWNELYAQEPDLQAALIALPEDTHAPASIAAMEHGLDVFCEKPMAFSVEQSRAMIAARDKHERVLQIGQQRRSNPLYYLAERMVREEGVLGEVLRIETFWDRWADWKRELPDIDKDFSPWGYDTLDRLINWRLYREYGHGLITENGTHQLDAASWLLGGKTAKSVCGMGAVRYGDGRETHDICAADFMFEGDTIVRFAQDFHQGLNYGWSYGELLLGSEAAMRITAEQEIVMYDRSRKATRIPISRLGEIEIAGLVSTPEELAEAEANRRGGGLRTYSYAHEMRIFCHCVRERTAPSCTGEIGHNAIAFTTTGADAQYSGKTMSFGPDVFLS